MTIAQFDLFYSLTVFLAGGFLIFFASRAFRVPPYLSILIYFWHTLFCILYFFRALSGTSDASSYFFWSLDPEKHFFALGTQGIVYLTHVFSYWLGLSFLGVFLIYNIFGTIGLLAFYATLRIVTAGMSRAYRLLALLIVFLPSMSFWSSAIGKDALAFLSIGLILWASLDMRKRLWLVGIALLIMLLARPHMALFIALALAGYVVLERYQSMTTKIFFFMLVMPGLAILTPIALESRGFAIEAGGRDVIEFYERRQDLELSETAGVDLANLSLPMRLFTYMFRPLPHEARSLEQGIAAIENIFLIGFFGYALVIYIYRRPKMLGDARTFLLFYAIISWGALSNLSINLGGASRQKWMILPCLFVIALSIVGMRSMRRRARQAASATRNRPRLTSYKSADAR